jgi:hypothetical protein
MAIQFGLSELNRHRSNIRDLAERPRKLRRFPGQRQ